MLDVTERAKQSIKDVGLGLRSCHYQYILDHSPDVPWFEALSDNYLVDGGPPLHYLQAIRQLYPITLHGVGLSIGSTDPLDKQYLHKLKHLITAVNPTLVSDHLCWISVEGQYLHDLLPLPYTEEAIQHVARRVSQIQDFLGLQILIENTSSYFQFKQNEMKEWDFINTIAERADCFILLDINNIYVSAYNHDFDPYLYLRNITRERVKQFHLAGYTDKRQYLFDTHGEKVHSPVWELYQTALRHFGQIPTIIEWDENIPPFSVLQTEMHKAQRLMNQYGCQQ